MKGQNVEIQRCIKSYYHDYFGQLMEMESLGTLHTLYNSDNPNEGFFEKKFNEEIELFPMVHGKFILVPLPKELS